MNLRSLFNSSASSMPAVSVTEAKRKLDSGEAIVVDVREPNELRQGHIAGPQDQRRRVSTGRCQGRRIGKVRSASWLWRFAEPSRHQPEHIPDPGIVSLCQHRCHINHRLNLDILAQISCQTGDDLIVDLVKEGATVYGTTPANRPTILIGLTDSGVETVPDTVLVPEGEHLTINIIQVGSVNPGAHLTVAVRWRKT